MPELPEVQTIVDDLNQKAKHWKVADFWTEWPKSVKNPLKSFRKNIIGRKIKEIRRRAKNILFYFDDGQVMLVHLKMTGHLLFKFEIRNSKFETNSKKQNNKFKTRSKKEKVAESYFDERVNGYVRHIWYLEGPRKQKATLEFSDLRKFGKIQLFENEKELLDDKDFSQLGVEPLSSEFTLKKFEEILDKKSKSTVRKTLMDYNAIVGIGNIYASEIMFEAGIDPKRKIKSLSVDEKKELHKQIKKVLGKAVKMRGTSDSDYRDTAGAPGSFQKVLKVYNREGKKCKRNGCEGMIERMKVDQRSAYWCPECQV